jgi:hypothetical protein
MISRVVKKVRSMTRTVRITFRCNEVEKLALSRIATTLGITESAALRRVVGAIASDLELLSGLAEDDLKRRGDGESGRSITPESQVYIYALRIIGALLTSYRAAGKSSHEATSTAKAREIDKGGCL